MRVIFGIILALGGIWLVWLMVTGLPMPWEAPTAKGSGNPIASFSPQYGVVAPFGSGTPGALGGPGWSFAV